MRRKVEGLTLDLTRIPESGVFVLEDLIVKKVDHCEECRSVVVGAFRECDGKALCGLCCAILKEKVNADVIERLKLEYAKPCGFCGKIDVRKHFDHINMFSKKGCVGIMVENSAKNEDILEEINKCQILCVGCHKKVTRYEWRHGFIAAKKRLNRLKRAGEDVMELEKALSDEYLACMGPFYGGHVGK